MVQFKSIDRTLAEEFGIEHEVEDTMEVLGECEHAYNLMREATRRAA